MIKKVKNILVLSFLICLTSCKNKEENIKKEIDIKKTESKDFSLSFDFPDTVYVNQYYNGKINFKNIFDTVTTKLLDAKKFRIIQYAFLITRDINYDKKHLKNITIDTLYTKSSKFIPLSAMSFNQLGVNYIDGIITDEVNIENGGKNEKGEPMTRVITYEFRATHKVVVIEEKGNK